MKYVLEPCLPEDDDRRRRRPIEALSEDDLFDMRYFFFFFFFPCRFGSRSRPPPRLFAALKGEIAEERAGGLRIFALEGAKGGGLVSLTRTTSRRR